MFSISFAVSQENRKEKCIFQEMKQTKLSKKLCLSCDKEIYSEYNFGFAPKKM